MEEEIKLWPTGQLDLKVNLIDTMYQGLLGQKLYFSTMFSGRCMKELWSAFGGGVIKARASLR